jgi:thiol-disulfide isomerase/thioredoxin
VASRTNESGRDRASKKNSARTSAQARIAAQRAAQQKNERRRNLFVTGGTLVGVIVIVAVIVIIGVHSNKPKAGASATGASKTVTSAIANVPSTAFDNVDFATSGFSAPAKTLTGQTALTANGKPEVLYMGAEYCPFCAAERWPLTVALSRFGSFSGLQQTFSHQAPEVYPSTPTLSFVGSTYTSDYITFESVEMESNAVKGSGYAPLQTPTAAQANLLDTLDVATSGGSTGGIPFIDYGNKYAQTDGANYSPQILAGLTQDQVAADLSQPTTKPGAAILATANAISSYICSIDGNKPATVCNSKGVTTAQVTLLAAASASG